jgi:universal stress protein A
MRILLPIDESHYSHAALRAVLTQFQTRGTQVRVLCVVEPVSAYLTSGMVPQFASASAEIERSREKESEELVEHAANKLRHVGFGASSAVEIGDPIAVILDQAKTWKADLIVLGSHGLKGLSRLLMGSISEAVVRHAECSVQVVRVRQPIKTKRS